MLHFIEKNTFYLDKADVLKFFAQQKLYTNECSILYQSFERHNMNHNITSMSFNYNISMTSYADECERNYRYRNKILIWLVKN